MKKIISSFALLVIMFTSAAHSQTFLTEEELIATFSGATATGISNGDGSTVWKQTYSVIEEGKTKGTIKGDFGGDAYKAKFYIKKGKWCENWGSGKGCWDIERVDDTHLRIYEYGKPLPNMWELIESGS